MVIGVTKDSSAVLPVGCIYMASGVGKRFGSNKLLASFHGKPLIQSIFDTTKELPFAEKLLVSVHEEVIALGKINQIPTALHHFPNRNQAIQFGLEQLIPLAKVPLAGCMFCPCDQPLLTVDTLYFMIQEFSKKPDYIYRLTDGTDPGAPVLFPARFFPELMDLPDKKGGSYLIRKYPSLVKELPVKDPLELLDVDTPETLNLLECETSTTKCL